MKSEILNPVFSTSLELPVHTPILFWTTVIVVTALVIHTAMSLYRHYERASKREKRYLRFLNELGITQAERNCLDQCGAALGIKDKFTMLTMPSQFQRVIRWANGHHGRQILVDRIRTKLEGNQNKKPDSKRRSIKTRRRFSTIQNAA